MKVNKSLIKGSIILLVAFGSYNLLNFIFQITMARTLSVVDYGIMATLFSIIYIFSVFTESIQAVITKYSSNESSPGKLKNLIKKANKNSIRFSFILFVIYGLASIPLSFFLQIDYPLLLLNGVVIFFVLLLPITRGVMQGRKKFKTLGSNMIVESVSKLVIAVFLVLLGWGVYGAVTGTIIGVFLALGVSRISLKKILKSKEKKMDTTGIRKYNKTSFFIIFIITIFYSIDILIAKLVFSPEVAGMYAIPSILSKAIFWGIQPISRAMFPISSKNNVRKNISQSAFNNSLVMVFGLIAISLLVFYFFPSLIINIFSGRAIPQSISILFYLGIATSVLSIVNLFLLYRLSLNRVKGYFYLIIFLILEIALLFIFSDNILEYSIALITASVAFLFGSIIIFRD